MCGSGERGGGERSGVDVVGGPSVGAGEAATLGGARAASTGPWWRVGDKNSDMAAAVASTRWEALRPCARGMNAWLFVRSDEISSAIKPYRDFQEWKLQLNDFSGAVYEGRLYGPDDFP
uniref:Uncharacterized protein n=2 Tax=Zea mays TaxID=4577 RepID=A0A804UFY3_MAIZE